MDVAIRGPLVFLAACAFLILVSWTSLSAHPHAWVSYRTTVYVNAKGEATAIREYWLFDKMYSVYALQDFDPNRNGKVEPEELLQLAEENLGSLKDFEYFTIVEDAEGKKQSFENPRDIASNFEEQKQDKKVPETKKPVVSSLSHLGGGLSRITQEVYLDRSDTPSDVKQIAMAFTLPFSSPHSLLGQGLSYRIYDSTYYIDMGHFDKEAVTFVDEKSGKVVSWCSVEIIRPKVDEQLVLKAYALDKNATAPRELGYHFSEKAVLKCQLPKS